LLGGSFNPAHGGHLRLSLFALKRLALDEIWWLVSPQNPLKPVAGMVPMRERLKKATAVATHPRIHATDIEARLGTRYTVDILERLTPRYPSVRFVWLMGADNLAQVDRWHRWQALFSHVAVAVIDRPGQTYAALSSPAFHALAPRRYKGPLHSLVRQPLPAWAFVFGFRDWTSATALRQSGTHG
jgi:nicotinate-nucleotide adenylyltransferase